MESNNYLGLSWTIYLHLVFSMSTDLQSHEQQALRHI